MAKGVKKKTEKKINDIGFGLERLAYSSGLPLVAGVDEAGRGPLAGPVVAAAVQLDPDRPVAGLMDSKQLTAARRAALADVLEARCRVGYGVVTAPDIDRVNILEASLCAMGRALQALFAAAGAAGHDNIGYDNTGHDTGRRLVLVDPHKNPRARDCCAGAHGLEVCEARLRALLEQRSPRYPLCLPVIKGDRYVASIAAASILAKVYRDRLMEKLALRYPEYGFEQHKGYGTKAHLAALQRYGPVAGEHRVSFAPVRRLGVALQDRD